MWRTDGLVLLALILSATIGCGGPEGTTGPQATNSPADGSVSADSLAAADQPATDPAVAAVGEFLEAVRTGDDRKAAMMLTATARKKTAEMQLEVAPPGSDTAQYTVGEVQYIDAAGARVRSTWSDLDLNGQRQSDEIQWMVRRESEGWRIAGVAAEVFAGEPPLLLDFEKPGEMVQKQKWLQEEMRRRALQENSQARRPENSGDLGPR